MRSPVLRYTQDRAAQPSKLFASLVFSFHGFLSVGSAGAAAAAVARAAYLTWLPVQAGVGVGVGAGVLAIEQPPRARAETRKEAGRRVRRTGVLQIRGIG